MAKPKNRSPDRSNVLGKTRTSFGWSRRPAPFWQERASLIWANCPQPFATGIHRGQA